MKVWSSDKGADHREPMVLDLRACGMLTLVFVMPVVNQEGVDIGPSSQ
jgi:hypothetical protein